MLAVFSRHVGQRLRVAVGYGALEREKDQHDRLLVLEIVEVLCHTIAIGEGDVGNLLSEIRLGRLARGLSAQGERRRQKTRKQEEKLSAAHMETSVGWWLFN